MILKGQGRRRGACMVRVGTATAVALGTAGLIVCGVTTAEAQAPRGGLFDAMSGQAEAGQPQGKGRLLVEAKELIYDNDRGTVTASGDVELNYQGRTLQADRVIYDRNNGRVTARGNVRLAEPGGAVVTGDRVELTEDFKTGFIDSLQITQKTPYRGVPVTTRFTAPRAERVEGETTVFERGTYTACEPCRESPERPPLWQVKAARIIHNNEEHVVYFENATVEVGGIPIAYMPYFWAPDPTVRRQTGFLAPDLITSSALGFGVGVPFFWAMAPNYDVTLTPTILSRQGFLGRAEFRHRLETGAYSVSFAGIYQQDGSAFLSGPLGAGDRDLRGSIQTSGLFFLNERWRYGWDITLLSDQFFLSNYSTTPSTLVTTYSGLRESISTAFLQGQGDRSWFDLRGYRIEGLSSADWNAQQPVVHPVLDYDKRINGPSFLGGEVAVTANLTSLSREAAAFQAARTDNVAYVLPAYGLYETCAVFDRDKCLVRGISGTTTRATAQASWRRTFIDDLGQSWTPFAYARVDGFMVNPDFAGHQNTQLQQFIGDDVTAARAMPAIGVEYRYPFIGALGSWGTQTIEPVAQVIARPSETLIGRVPNEDAQSLVFDDTNLFRWDRFSGFDRVEGGVRANVGAQYAVRGPNQFYASALFGQSYHLAGRNSFAVGDLTNTGIQSGLDTDPSDYVGRVALQPTSGISFIARGRFNQQDFSASRLEGTTTLSLDPLVPLTLAATYARYEAQPLIGIDKRREGLSTVASYKVTPNWSLTSALVFDLDRYSDNRAANITGAPYGLSAYMFGAAYDDECTTLSLSYSSAPRDLSTGTTDPVQTVLFRFDLKTLGGSELRQSLNSTTSVADGLTGR